jgi:hypothetical protein
MESNKNKEVDKMEKVTVAKLMGFLTEVNTEKLKKGHKLLEVGGAYGYIELRKDGSLLESGSKKDIYNAVITNRYKN